MRILLVSMAFVMLLFAVWDLLVPRARYVNSSPLPGAYLATPPTAVIVSFSDELAPHSNLSVASTITLSASGEREYSDGKRLTTEGPDLGDPQHRALRVNLDPGLPGGLYWVKWTTVAARGGAQRSGSFCFGVGMPVPTYLTRDIPNTLRERNYQWRGRRAALLSGVLLIALGALLPRSPWRSEQGTNLPSDGV